MNNIDLGHAQRESRHLCQLFGGAFLLAVLVAFDAPTRFLWVVALLGLAFLASLIHVIRLHNRAPDYDLPIDEDFFGRTGKIRARD